MAGHEGSQSIQFMYSLADNQQLGKGNSSQKVNAKFKNTVLSPRKREVTTIQLPSSPYKRSPYKRGAFQVTSFVGDGLTVFVRKFYPIRGGTP
jgi:hypothetical protein